MHQKYPSIVMFNGLDLHISKNRVIWISPLLLQPPVQDGGSILENIYVNPYITTQTPEED